MGPQGFFITLLFMVGIILPRMNSSGFLIGQLAYHEDATSKHTIRVAYSSEDYCVKRTQGAIRKQIAAFRWLRFELPVQMATKQSVNW
jgi:hypothetical protein